MFVFEQEYKNMPSAIKDFEIEEGSLPRGWYQIRVKFCGNVVDVFRNKTMAEAESAFDRAGYKRVAWKEGSRIVLRDK